MKKKIMIIMTIITLMLCIKDVNAEDAWPQSFTYNSYTYSIEKVSLNVYEYNDDSSEGRTNYSNESPTTTIDLAASDYTIAPDSKDSTILGIPAVLINLNLNVTNSSLTQLLASQMTAVEQDSKKSYLVDLVVSYKITAHPDNLAYAYKANAIRSQSGSVMGVVNTNGITLDSTNTQVINTIVIDKNDDSGEVYLYYEDQYASDNGVGLFAFNYTLLTEGEYTDVTATPPTTSQIVMFHNLTNIDELVANAASIKPGSTPQPTPEQVKVPSTAWGNSSTSVLFGILLMMIGTFTVSRVLLKNN